MHRIPTYNDRQISAGVVSENELLLPKQKITTNFIIPAPGATGIPQIDQVQQGVSKQFPSPNQFAVPNVSTVTPSYQSSTPSNVNGSSALFSTYQPHIPSSVNGISAPSSFINLPPPPPIISSSNAFLSSVLTPTPSASVNEVNFNNYNTIKYKKKFSL